MVNKQFLLSLILAIFIMAIHSEEVNSNDVNLATKNNTNHECLINSDCFSFFNCESNKCVHKKLFSPLKLQEFFGFLVLFLAGIMSSIAGIAGGEFFVPTFVQIYRFDIKIAIQSSIFIIFGTQLVRFIIALKVRRQKKNQPIIDYNLAAILAPALFVGTLCGVPLNIMMPQWLLLLLFTALMTYNFYKAYGSGKSLYALEQIQNELTQPLVQVRCLKDDLPSTTDVDIELEDLPKTYSMHSKSNKQHAKKIQQQPKTKSEQILNEIKAEEAKPIQMKKLKYILFCLGSIIAVNLFKGSSKVPSIIGVPKFSIVYWLIFISYIPLSLAILYFLSKELNEEHKVKRQVGYKFDLQEVQYNLETIKTLSIIGFTIGIFSALIGIGGGVVLTPFLIAWKVQPDVVSYTSSFIALIGSTSNLFQFMLYSQIQWDYTIFSFIVCIPAFYYGLTVLLAKIVEKNKKSYIIFTLAVIIVLATIIILISGIENIIQDQQKGKNIWAFSKLQ